VHEAGKVCFWGEKEVLGLRVIVMGGLGTSGMLGEYACVVSMHSQAPARTGEI
jgi:hypothetical protein